MFGFFKGILFLDASEFELHKSDNHNWMVTKNGAIPYIGTKDKCKTYMKQFKKKPVHA